MNSLNFYVNTFNSGSYKAFAIIMEKNIETLTFHAFKYCKRKEIAEEIVADTFTKLWERRGSFESELSIKAFLYITTRNACLDYLKSKNRENHCRSEELDDYLINNDTDPLTQIIHAELIKELHGQLKKLPERQAQVFKMSCLEGFSVAEICEELNITPNALYIAKKKAIDTIKQSLSKEILYMLIIFQYFQ